MSTDNRPVSGLEEVDALLKAAPLDVSDLTSHELAAYRQRRVTQGWRLKIRFPDQFRRLDVLVGPNFPRDPVLVALVDRPPFLTWPHVEKDGVLCLLPSTADVNHTTPAEVAANVLSEACELVEQLIRGERNEDFRREFLSYWCWGAERWQRDIWSLLKPQGPSRHMYYWPGQAFYLLGEAPEQLTKWLVHYIRGFKSDTSQYLKGTLLWLPELPAPDAYPNCASDVLEIARSLGCAGLLDHHLSADEPPLIILGGESGAGPCFAATIAPEAAHNSPPRTQRHSRVTNGFRPQHVPQPLRRLRRFGSAPVIRATVERADAPWIHGRDKDSRFQIMRDSSVTVLGCGSLGGHVAVRLAEAGIGQINLADPEPLQWPNVGRHPLSAHHVGRSKSEALAQLLRQQYPHASDFRSSSLSCEELIRSESPLLTDCQLVIAAMGNWAAEGALNAWHLMRNRRVSVLYAWSEPHAVAGHAVAIVPGSSCLQCGFRDNGEPTFRVGQWPVETTLVEPGCGAVFQPYGPIEFSHIVALTAEAVLDCLLGRVTQSTHRIWCGRRSILDSTGGSWTDEWASLAANRASGGFIEERAWPTRSNCSQCSVLHA